MRLVLILTYFATLLSAAAWDNTRVFDWDEAQK